MHDLNGIGEGHISWLAQFDVTKYDPDVVADLKPRFDLTKNLQEQFQAAGAPYTVDSIPAPANILTNNGIIKIAAMILGESAYTAYPWTASYVRMGVGAVATAATQADTDLNGAQTTAGRYWMTMDATYPQRSLAVITYRATYSDTVANFAWNEWGLDLTTGSPTAGTGAATNTGSNGTGSLLNHKVSSLGTKASGAIWIATATLTITSS